jgi:hypothetical protein
MLTLYPDRPRTYDLCAERGNGCIRILNLGRDPIRMLLH